MIIEEIIEQYFQDIDYHLKMRIDEERGVFPNYHDFIIDIYHELIKKKPIYIGDYYMYSIIYTPKTDEFIDNIEVSCCVYSDMNNLESSKFINTKKNGMDLTKDGKLTNCKIIVSLNGENGKIPKNEFLYTLIHEMQHAYRYWNILSQNNGKLDSAEEYRRERYDRNQYAADTARKNSKENNESEALFLDRLITMSLYDLDNDEINAYSSEIYEYIKQNEYINIKNYREYINDIEIFKKLKIASNTIKIIDNKLSSDNKEYYYTIFAMSYDKFFNNNSKFSEKKRAMLIRQYLIRKLNRGYKQATKVLMHALTDNNRIVNESTQSIISYRNVDISNLLKKFDVF